MSYFMLKNEILFSDMQIIHDGMLIVIFILVNKQR